MATRNNSTELAIDAILEDYTADELKSKLDFMFHRTLEMSDGMTGSDLADMFDVHNRIVALFKSREVETTLKRN